MSTVDTREVRRALETLALVETRGDAFEPGREVVLLTHARRVLAYMPMLLDEVDQLRTMRTEVQRIADLADEAQSELLVTPGSAAELVASFARSTVTGLRRALGEVTE